MHLAVINHVIITPTQWSTSVPAEKYSQHVRAGPRLTLNRCAGLCPWE